MIHNDAFLQEIIENPDDDGPRLVYADWLEEHARPERAEFIRVQMMLARTPVGDPRRAELEVRERELLAEHEEEWVGRFHEVVKSWRFRRGFVEEFDLTADDFIAHTPVIFASAPVRHARIGFCWNNTGEELACLSASPYLGRLRTIDLSFGCYFVSDSDLQTLSTLSPLLKRLNSFDAMECHVSEAGLRPVLLSPDLLRLLGLHLSECELHGAEGVRPLADSARLTHLTHLTLDDNDLGDGGVQVLVASRNCRGLESLGLAECRVGDAGADALARSPHLRHLISLDVKENAVGDAGVAALAGSPHLAAVQYLHLNRNHVTDAGAQALASSPHLGRLRALVLWENDIGPAAQELLKARFGDRVSF